MSSESERPGEGTGTRAEGSDLLLAFADALLSASQRDPGRAAAQVHQYVTFFLRDDEIGIPILQCREIVHAPAITRVPEAPEHVRGVVNLRGRIVPAVDARKCLGYEGSALVAKPRLLVIEVAGRLFALLVDRVARIIKLTASEIEAPPASGGVFGAVGVVRVGGAAIYLTDAEHVLQLGPAVPTPRSDGA